MRMEKKPVSLAPDFREMVKVWKGGPYVPRAQVGEFSGGMLHPKTMANLDSRGEGPERVKYGKKVYYHVDKLAEWAEKRASGQQVA